MSSQIPHVPDGRKQIDPAPPVRRLVFDFTGLLVVPSDGPAYERALRAAARAGR